MAARNVFDGAFEQEEAVPPRDTNGAGNGGPKPDPSLPEFEEDRYLIAEANNAFNRARRANTSALAFGIPLLVLSFCALANFEVHIFQKASIPLPNNFYAGTAVLWVVALSVATPLYFYLFRKRLAETRDGLSSAQQSYVARRISTKEGRVQYYREELFRLSSKAARIFFDDKKRFDIASVWSQKAGEILDVADSTARLNIVNGYLNSLQELVAREEREQADERRWQLWAIGVMAFFIGLLVFAAIATIKDNALLTLKVFGVPLSAMLWGAAGSLAAILYRFYTEQGQIRFAAEFRWLIARPIIGIVMGAVVNLALISGLVLIAGTASEQVSNPRQEALWIIAFLAGFSDKFYLGVIDLLVARTVSTQEIDSNTVVTQKERIPEPSPPSGLEPAKTTAPPTAG